MVEMTKLKEGINAFEDDSATPQPRIAETLAAKLTAEFTRDTPLDEAASAKLKTLIANALDERFLDTQDIRLGKILGSALATL
jgi:hypothetical protein